eukprot:COSAG01_NODE_18426_length_1077_cov_1.178937_1_plen_203_part_00
MSALRPSRHSCLAFRRLASSALLRTSSTISSSLSTDGHPLVSTSPVTSCSNGSGEDWSLFGGFSSFLRHRLRLQLAQPANKTQTAVAAPMASHGGRGITSHRELANPQAHGAAASVANATASEHSDPCTVTRSCPLWSLLVGVGPGTRRENPTGRDEAGGALRPNQQINVRDPYGWGLLYGGPTQATGHRSRRLEVRSLWSR